MRDTMLERCGCTVTSLDSTSDTIASRMGVRLTRSACDSSASTNSMPGGKSSVMMRL